MALEPLRIAATMTSERPRLLLSGIDSLYVSYFVSMGESWLDFDELAYQQQRLKESRRDEVAKITIGGESFALMPYGLHPYRYVLVNEDFEIRLTEKMQPSCHVRFSSKGLWSHGYAALLARLNAWLEAINGALYRPSSVSRIDWSFDYDLPLVDFAADHFVTRASKDAIYREHGLVQTLTFGRGEVVVRLYDKSAEIEQESGKVFFHQLWGQKENVWRVEFQIRRERLAPGGITNPTEIGIHQGDILRELANSHTTLRKPSGDSNRSRWPLHPLWQGLLQDISALDQTGLIREIDRQAPLNWRLFQQTKSLHGGLKGLAAVLGLLKGATAPLTIEEVHAELLSHLKLHHDPYTWEQDVAARITKYSYGLW
ncbi:hypothetical protein [Limibacillus halophilus]|uniref:Replication initiation factor n=1 Tax=Limibacillus halophilus TaxID=1579333 RepID=A0A839SSJ1_9PROT|nr:hypothetical protein [Limibacillus halophilus]MBB3065771.1 hypothetical protein [Limibacillus halophilus]